MAASSISMQCASAQASNDSAPQTQVQVPNRPATALFQGAQGEQRTTIHFDPTTQVVTIKMLVQDPRGYFIPNIRRENFAVYENGVRQENASVEIEHAEFGHALHGMFSNTRYPTLAGTSTARDFVEFPSQFNEHWATYPAVFNHFAKH